jgi:hypothetical protein
MFEAYALTPAGVQHTLTTPATAPRRRSEPNVREKPARWSLPDGACPMEPARWSLWGMHSSNPRAPPPYAERARLKHLALILPSSLPSGQTPWLSH